MTTELRSLRRSEWDVWYDGILRAFGTAGRAERELYRDLTEIERSTAAWDGDRIVGSMSLISFRMTVPGGAVVPTAGLSMVHVAATHRRRGILRSMMRRQLEDVRAAGVEPLSVLTASEPGIYGRFGYGLATRELNAVIDTTRVTFEVPPESERIRLRIFDDAASVGDECEAVYARRVSERAGMLERRPGWERLPLLDTREGAVPLACVLAQDEAGEVRGYARYALRSSWDHRGVPSGSVLLRDLEALDPASYGALWRFLSGMDLMRELRVRGRPVDDPWLHMAGDSVRLCEPSWRDGMFARPWRWGRRWRRVRTPRPWTWSSMSRTPSARGTRAVGASRATARARRASAPATPPIWRCPYGSWAPRIWEARPCGRSRSPAACAS
jgi:predicted acetyltransferase